MPKSIPCPHCQKPLKLSMLRSKLNRIAGQLGGRPASEDRCPCGLMTRARAEQRKHKCADLPPETGLIV